jgi:hypothetical protein
MFLSKFLYKIRLKAIQNSSIIINSNPFSGQFSLNQIEQAKKNRKLNQGWFVRNYYKLKTKLSNEEFEQLAENLGLGYSELIEIERILKNSGK